MDLLSIKPFFYIRRWIKIAYIWATSISRWINWTLVNYWSLHLEMTEDSQTFELTTASYSSRFVWEYLVFQTYDFYLTMPIFKLVL